MKKLGILLLTLLLIPNGMALFSCRQKNNEETTTAPEQSAGTVPLIEDGATDYVIVFGKYASNAIRLAVSNLSYNIRKQTGVEIPTWLHILAAVQKSYRIPARTQGRLHHGSLRRGDRFCGKL